jgi:N6-adenosine-specific RNA methylase IME4
MHPILYQNDDRTVSVIDVPTSVAHGQGIHGRILSTQARSEPFTSTEPKSLKTRHKVLARSSLAQHDVEYVDVVSRALADVLSNYDGPWNSPRLIHESGAQQADGLQRSDAIMSKHFQDFTAAWCSRPIVQIKPNTSHIWETLNSWDGSYYNDSGDVVCFQLKSKHSLSTLPEPENMPKIPLNTDAFTFRIPLRSSFLLSDCRRPETFRNHVRWMSQEYDKSRLFDFILLDPPWENRSVKRRAAYKTNSVQAMIDDMDLSSYLQPGGLVGMWITNKFAHRETVLGPRGIFEFLNVSLIEEWIWVKTTTSGEPVTQLDGVWRKPYEVLLLGRAPESRLQVAQPAEEVRRRVIAGVPDFHSRKPCLKTLIEPFLPKDYQALEVFARYLVEGWTSWGNEVLKYNYEGYCKPEEDASD